MIENRNRRLVNKLVGYNVKYGKKSFKRYPYISEEVILESFLAEIKDNKLPNEVLLLFKEVWNSRFWEKNGYDGATLVKDNTEPRVDNFIHDYCYRMGYVYNKVDVIYRELMILTGYSKFKAYRRYYAVSTARPYFILKRKYNGNYKKVNSIEIDNLYSKLKNK